MIFIVTGLAGTNKSSIAQELAGDNIVHCDEMRYDKSDGTRWIKRSYADFRTLVLDAVREKQAIGDVAVEGTYYDATDPENARIRVFQELAEDPVCTQVCILRMGRADQIERIIARAIRRATGEEPQGALPETPKTVTRLVLKCADNYEDCIRALDEFRENIERSATVDVRLIDE